jgi:hypothetical protein
MMRYLTDGRSAAPGASVCRDAMCSSNDGHVRAHGARHGKIYLWYTR